MTFTVRKYEIMDWNDLSEDAHMLCFGEYRPCVLERYDFALGVLDENGLISGYVTCIELDAKTIYWQYGGIFPKYKGSVYSLRGFGQIIGWCREHYNRISTKIENTNTAMLKLAIKMGFIVNGVHVFGGKVFLELTNEFGDVA